MKSVCIQSFSNPYFPEFGLNTERSNKDTLQAVIIAIIENTKLTGITSLRNNIQLAAIILKFNTL